MNGLVFTVYGVAQSQGSARAFIVHGHAHVTHSNRNLQQWRLLVADAASRAIAASDPPWTVLDGGVRLSCAFFLPRPQSLPKRHTAHTKAIDLDKAIRAIGDALSHIAYHDDAQVCEIVAAKYYARPGEAPHVTIRVEPTAGVIGSFVVTPAPLPLFTEETRPA